MKSVLALLHKEWIELLLLLFSPQNLYGNSISVALVLIVTAIFLPLQMGVDWVGSTAMFTMSIVGVPFVIVGTLIPGSFAVERERNTLEALLLTPASDLAILVGKWLPPTIVGWGTNLLSACLGVMVVGKNPLLLPAELIVNILGFSILVSMLIATIGMMSSFYTKTYLSAQQSLVGKLFIPMAVLAYLVGPFSPAVWKTEMANLFFRLDIGNPTLYISLLLVFINIVLFIIARMKFQRKHMLLLD